jgi:drug/metabolite transporter superfamily protein YnfA
MKDMLRWGGIYVVVFTALYFFVPTFLHRRDFDRAFSAYINHPSPETNAALDQERAINERILVEIDVMGALALTALGYVVVVLVPPALQR